MKMSTTPPLGHPFALRQRVTMTDEARARGLAWRGHSSGVVVGYGTSPLGVYVLRDGLKHPTSYHVNFWRPTGAKR